jgi:hypothetical protein
MKLTLILLFLAISGRYSAQTDTSEYREIKRVIEQVFDAMRTGDSSALRRCFYPNAQLHSCYFSLKKQAYEVSEEQLIDFLVTVGTPHNEVWDERVLRIEIKQDETMAIAWVPYEFYVDNIYSHEGTNAIQLVKTDDGWRILSITDTRKRK